MSRPKVVVLSLVADALLDMGRQIVGSANYSEPFSAYREGNAPGALSGFRTGMLFSGVLTEAQYKRLCVLIEAVYVARDVVSDASKRAKAVAP